MCAHRCIYIHVCCLFDFVCVLVNVFICGFVNLCVHVAVCKY